MRLSAILTLALVLDPPATGLMAAPIDRLSRPFVELAALMAVVSLVMARWLPAGTTPWRATLLGGLVLEMQGRVYDGSVRARLQNLRARLVFEGRRA